MIDAGWFDGEFLRDWSNGPFLVREDNGTLLRAAMLEAGEDGFVAWDEGRGRPLPYNPSTRAYDLPPVRLALSGRFTVAGRDGPIPCRPAFELYVAQCRAMSPEVASKITGIGTGAIHEAARLLWQHRPVAHYTWTGLEQHSNATQTDRSIAILHALTGSVDVAGGNLHLTQVPVNDVSGNELRDPRQLRKALGLSERPLGLGTSGWILSDDLYRAVIDAQPYRVRGLVGFGANLLLSHADAARGAEALRQLEFHMQTDLYMTRPPPSRTLFFRWPVPGSAKVCASASGSIRTPANWSNSALRWSRRAAKPGPISTSCSISRSAWASETTSGTATSRRRCTIILRRAASAWTH
jgi:anaerobic selenocysteine-containing dehydrogenase